MNMKLKLLRLKILLIMLVLSCLKTYAQTNTSTGNQIETDSLVTINIKYIRLANEKLLERQYLLDVNHYKDSIIGDYRQYVKEQEKINNIYKNKLSEYDRINKELNKSLDKKQKTNLILGSVSAASIVTIVLLAIIK